MVEFDFEKLMETFTEICPDFTAEPDYKRATVSRRFAEQVIFEYSKEAKLAKYLRDDKSWRFQLDSQGKVGKICAEVVITMYNMKTPPVYQPTMLHGYLQLTFKQASLLAVAKYCQMIPHLVERGQYVLTPLAGAIFNNDDMPRLAAELRETLPKVMMEVISSCQTDGYYLEHSCCSVALRALQKTVFDREQRISLLKKCMKSYQLRGKEFDLKKYIIYCRFVRSNSTDKKAPPQDLNYLLNEVLPLISPSESPENLSPPAPIKQKNILKCAANFGNKTKK